MYSINKIYQSSRKLLILREKCVKIYLNNKRSLSFEKERKLKMLKKYLKYIIAFAVVVSIHVPVDFLGFS